jgi:hypothetical protein
MRVFTVRHDSNHFAYFLTKLVRDSHCFYDFRAIPLSDTWVAPKVELYKKSRHKLGNFFQPSYGCLICDPTAVAALGDEYLHPAGELLPLKYGRVTYSVFNCTHVIDCLDYDRTRFERGRITGVASAADRENLFDMSLRLGRIVEFAFLPDLLPRSGFFKIPHVSGTRLFFADGRTRGECLLMDVLKEHKLRGLVCEPAIEE